MSGPGLLDEALLLKALPRAGWQRIGISDPESVAAHSWGVAWLALLLRPPGLDQERILSLAIIHDIAEIRVGDITPYDGVSRSEKHRRERRAARDLLAHRPELLGLWEDYATRSSPEARFVHQLDKIDMALQARHYARHRGHDTREFIQNARAAVSHPTLVSLLDELDD